MLVAVPKRVRPTWAEVGIRNAGFRKTVNALKFALSWGLATAELGREPTTVDEFAQVMKLSRRTAFRDQEHFREAFPSETTPARINIMTGAQERYDETYKRLKEAGAAERALEHVAFDVGASLADV
jgi:hypothetical protein